MLSKGPEARFCNLVKKKKPKKNPTDFGGIFNDIDNISNNIDEKNSQKIALFPMTPPLKVMLFILNAFDDI